MFPHLASALEIERWADTLEARGELPRLARRLAQQTNDQLTVLDFPAGEATGSPGYDGRIEAQKGTPFVPKGTSVWEVGTGSDPKKKANSDYATRTSDPLGVTPADTTFVFLTCRRWEGKRSWETEKRGEGIWRDVRAFDVQDIETALESAPAAHVWLSEVLGKPIQGVETLEEWWIGFSNSTLPILTPELVVAGRSDEAAELLRRLELEPHVITITAPSQDDVLAFVAAVLLTSPEEGRADLLARALIVRDAYSLRVLEKSADLLILVPFEEELRRDAIRVQSHHVVLLSEGGVAADLTIPAIPISPATGLLSEMQLGDERATTLARALNRSVVAFQHEAPARPGTARRDWAELFTSKTIRRAWLAGEWSEQRSGDLDVMSEILGVPYEDGSDELARAARGPDPLFAREGARWARVLPRAAFAYARPSINKSDLDAAERVIQIVLGAVDPALELPVEERWRASIQGKTRIHSSALRTGLATTLALLGAVGDSVSLGAGRTAQTWAATTVFQLLSRANGDSDAQIWMSLTDVLPLMAEAAPNEFLAAVEEGIRGEQPLLRGMFLDHEGEANVLSVSSPHTGLLWALEGLAWSADYLGLVSDALAVLAEIDPGGRLSNRPARSLESIFRPWLPQTAAPADARLRVIDRLVSQHEVIGWALLLALLPQPYAVGEYTHSPEFREWKPDAEVRVSQREYWEVSLAISERVLTLAATDADRWVNIVEKLSDLPEPARNQALTALRSLGANAMLDDAGRTKLWNSLESVVRHHRAFSSAEWALPPDVVDELASISSAFEPSDQVITNLWLFESYVPRLEEGTRADFASYQERLRAHRRDAVGRILEAEGIEGVLRTARAADVPWAVGQALADAMTEADDDSITGLLDSSDPKEAALALGFVGTRLTQNGWAWADQKIAALDDRPLAQARILRTSNDLPPAWQRLDGLGDEARASYWAEFVPYGLGSDFALANEVAEHLLEYSRAGAAVDILSMYSHGEPRLDPDLVVRALEALLALENNDPEPTKVSNYEIETLLDYVRSHVDSDRVGVLEWRLLPALGPHAASPVLHRRLAQEPNFFIEVVSLCYRARNDQADPAVSPAVASNAWRLLHDWKIVPGTHETEGSIDRDELMQWVNAARAAAAAVDRSEVADTHIGQVFAHAPSDPDGSWPCAAVRDVIESTASRDLENGLRIGTYNLRGVTSRSLTEGGQQERGQAARYTELARKILEGWPRTAAVLRSLAEGYHAEARMHDEQAERFLKGMDR